MPAAIRRASMDSIAICAIFKDEARYILEWIAFHRVVGVDHFVLYDNGSKDDTAALIRGSKFAADVTLIDWPQRAGQLPAYADFIAHHARRFTWAAIIDIDEFIHPLETETIRPLLPRYDRFSAVLLHWMMFGASGHKARPDGLVIHNYTHRVPLDDGVNCHVKSLLRTRDLRGIQTTPHIFATSGDCCNARGEPVLPYALQEKVCADVMVVNHYFTKSEEDWQAKVRRGKADEVAPTDNAYTDEFFNAMSHGAVEEDRKILRFLPRLQRELRDASLPASSALLPGPGPQPRFLQFGIGITTANNRPALSDTLDRVLQHTKYPSTAIAVADDGSTDGTLDMLRARQITTATGRPMGPAWNANRALFMLAELLHCDIVLLLHDGCFPVRDEWEREWMQAAIRWGHANIAATWLREHFVAGAGTLDEPIRSTRIATHCAVFSREALLFGGYLDPHAPGDARCRHALRLLQLDHGGANESVGGQTMPLFKLLWGDIEIATMPPIGVAVPPAAPALPDGGSYRPPWRNDVEAGQFRDEMQAIFPRALL
jgi:hypothetical protein